MVPDVVLGAIIGVIGTVIGYGISSWSELKATEKRISADKDQLEERLESQEEQLKKRLTAQQEQLEKRLRAQQTQLETRISAENKRRRAEYVLEREIDALMDLFETMEECHTTVQEFANVSSTNPESISVDTYYDEVKPKLRSLRIAIRQKGIFLTEDELENHISPVLGQVRQADVAIEQRQNNPNRDLSEGERIDWGEFIGTFENAQNFMREKLHDRIEELESD